MLPLPARRYRGWSRRNTSEPVYRDSGQFPGSRAGFCLRSVPAPLPSAESCSDRMHPCSRDNLPDPGSFPRARFPEWSEHRPAQAWVSGSASALGWESAWLPVWPMLPVPAQRPHRSSSPGSAADSDSPQRPETESEQSGSEVISGWFFFSCAFPVSEKRLSHSEAASFL